MKTKPKRKTKPRAKARKQTSSRVSTIAGRVLKALGAHKARDTLLYSEEGPWVTVAEMRALAASCLSQDEQPRERRVRK